MTYVLSKFCYYTKFSRVLPNVYIQIKFFSHIWNNLCVSNLNIIIRPLHRFAMTLSSRRRAQLIYIWGESLAFKHGNIAELSRDVCKWILVRN